VRLLAIEMHIRTRTRGHHNEMASFISLKKFKYRCTMFSPKVFSNFYFFSASLVFFSFVNAFCVTEKVINSHFVHCVVWMESDAFEINIFIANMFEYGMLL
jgi:hypothetical protein